MKKKMIATLLTFTMALSMVACGNAENTGTSNDNANVSTESAVAEVPETSAPTTESVVDTEAIVETEPEVADTRIEDGMTKIERLFEAHDVLLSQGKVLENYVQHDTEGLTYVCFDLKQFTTADGIKYQRNTAIYATAIEYYDHYVNNNGEYYDLETWLSTQENSDAIASKYFILGEDYETNNTLLFEAIGLIAYMKACETVEPIELIETSEYVISGITSAYAIPLNCDDDVDLTAVFDADGRLLNICTPTDGSWDNYVTSFPNGVPGGN